MILDVIELRQVRFVVSMFLENYTFYWTFIFFKKNNWVPRRADNAPKTIDELHREIEEERRIKQIEIDNINQQDAAKRAQQHGGQRGGRGGHYHQDGNLKSANMDGQAYAASRPKATNIGNKISDIKKISDTSKQSFMFAPPSFNKVQNPRPDSNIRPNVQLYNESDSRRGSMPLGEPKPTYGHQSSQDKKLERVKQMDKSETSSQASSRDASLTRQDQSRDNNNSVTCASDSSGNNLLKLNLK